jgi:hypothetical protein
MQWMWGHRRESARRALALLRVRHGARPGPQRSQKYFVPGRGKWPTGSRAWRSPRLSAWVLHNLEPADDDLRCPPVAMETRIPLSRGRAVVLGQVMSCPMPPESCAIVAGVRRVGSGLGAGGSGGNSATTRGSAWCENSIRQAAGVRNVHMNYRHLLSPVVRYGCFHWLDNLPCL